jgi:predicted nucleic-acid-binding protein
MKKMTIIGNCQANALSKFLLSNSSFSSNYESILNNLNHSSRIFILVIVFIGIVKLILINHFFEN